MEDDKSNGLTQSIGMTLLFEDPITFELMENAIVAICGHSFSESTIKSYVTEHSVCPLCNRQLTLNDLMPNYRLRDAIGQYKKYKDQGGNGNPSEIILSIPTTQVDHDELRKQINPSYVRTEECKLIVEIFSANNLKDRVAFGTSSPYCKITFQGRSQSTSIIKGNLNPKWNESFIFDVRNENEDKSVIIEVRDHISIGRDPFLGKVVIDWPTIESDGLKVEKSLQLTRVGGKREIISNINIRVRYVNLNASDSSNEKKVETPPPVRVVVPIERLGSQEDVDLDAEMAKAILDEGK